MIFVVRLLEYTFPALWAKNPILRRCSGFGERRTKGPLTRKGASGSCTPRGTACPKTHACREELRGRGASPSGVRSLHGRMVMAMLLSRCTDNARYLYTPLEAVRSPLKMQQNLV